MSKKVLFLTDFPANGSGYATISKPICSGLVERSYEVKLVALQNMGEEHWNNFAVIPAETLQEGAVACHNLIKIWKPDVIIVALDIPMQGQIYKYLQQTGIKYIAITPMENGPLMQSWAGSLMQLDDVFFISELGKQEGLKAGVEKSKHLLVGLDPDVWRPAVEGERETVRKNLGFEEDEKVVLTVADNQERKNLWAGLKIVSNMKRDNPKMKIKYVLVTREHQPSGYNLMELAFSLGLQKEIVLFERGMPNSQLRLLYIACDAFLLPSKAEGLGLPVMEAMMCGAKCVVTETGALPDLIKNHGWLVPPVYSFIDVWGNSKRDFIDTDNGADKLLYAITCGLGHVEKFYDQSVMVDQIQQSIEDVTNGKD